MHRGMGKVPCSRRRSSGGHPYDDRPRLSTPHTAPEKTPPDMPHTASAPSSYLDTSIPFNLPPRRSMKMLKDGSDFVWPDAAHALFVRGLQAWKFINIGSKRTRAPRGEGKTDFLTRYLQSHGVERTKKQVASHLQVLRTEWRNLDNPVLLSLVDETASHSRSLSEPSLPPPATPCTSSPSATSISVFHPSPEPTDERAISTPAPPSPVSTVSPPTSSSLFHPAHNIYSARSVSFPVALSDDPYSTHTAPDMVSWQTENTVWNASTDRFASHQADSFPRHQSHYPVTGYDLAASFHNHQRPARALDSQLHDSPGFGADYFDVQALSGLRDPSSTISSLPVDSHSQSSLDIETVHSPAHDLAPQVDIPLSPYNSYNNPSSYPILQQPTPRDGFGNTNMSYGIEPYQSHFSTGEQQLQQSNSSQHHALGIVGSTSFDVVEPDFLAGVPQVQPQWVRPPATFPRSPDTSERCRSPEL